VSATDILEERAPLHLQFSSPGSKRVVEGLGQGECPLQPVHALLGSSVNFLFILSGATGQKRLSDLENL
jgi:hypothetical protein